MANGDDHTIIKRTTVFVGFFHVYRNKQRNYSRFQNFNCTRVFIYNINNDQFCFHPFFVQTDRHWFSSLKYILSFILFCVYDRKTLPIFRCNLLCNVDSKWPQNIKRIIEWARKGKRRKKNSTQRTIIINKNNVELNWRKKNQRREY